ncbi:MAG: FG-GAP-like repeat-containing protein [Candidatus Omnitrophota bacterium]
MKLKLLILSLVILAVMSVESAASILITEILADPAPAPLGDANGDSVVSASDDEFVEIFNSGNGPVDLSGWMLKDAARPRHYFPAGTVLSAKGYLVVFGGGSPDLPGVYWQLASTDTLQLNNTGDEVSLWDAQGALADKFVYGAEGGRDQSLARFPEVGGAPGVLHSSIPEAEGRLFSPGTSADGRMGGGAGAASVPEPPTMICLLIGLVFLAYKYVLQNAKKYFMPSGAQGVNMRKIRILMIWAVLILFAGSSTAFAAQSTPPPDEDAAPAAPAAPSAGDEDSASGNNSGSGNSSVTSQSLTSSSSEYPQYFNTKLIDVDLQTGSASTSVAINVPPGRNGIQPNLTLLYNSNMRNGILGAGWVLELGSIQRSTKRGVPKYNSTDNFVLLQSGSAQELVYDRDAGFYRPDIEGSFMKIIYDSGVDQWVATDKTGVKYYFGQSALSRQMNNPLNKTFKWCLDRIEDSFGNDLTIEYVKDQEQIYPKKISYTGNKNTSSAPYAEVEFGLEDRAADLNTSYLSGYKITTAKRISWVRVFADGYLQRRYQLGYTRSLGTGQSLLTSVKQYGADDWTTLPATIFTYSEGKPDFESAKKITNYPAKSLDSSLVRMADMNNDGLPDIIRTYPENNSAYDIYLNTSAGGQVDFAASFPAQNAPSRGFHNPCVKFLDLNGDGLLDVIWGEQSPFRVWLNNGKDGFYPANDLTNYPTDIDIGHPQVQFFDMNADGLPDMVRSYANSRYDIYLNVSTEAKADFASPFKATNSPSRELSDPEMRLADFNGDGLLDVMMAASKPYYLWINNGQNGFEPVRNILTSPDASVGYGLVVFVDMNGDGLADILKTDSGLGQPYSIYWNNGCGDFEQPVNAVNPPAVGTDNLNLKMVDVNADGLLDVFIGRDAGAGYYYQVSLNNGQGNFILNYTVAAYPSTVGLDASSVLLTDVNGDNLPDMVFSSETDLPYKVWVNKNGGQSLRPDILVKMENSVGAETEIEYGFQPVRGMLGFEYKKAMSRFLLPTVKTITNKVTQGGEYKITYSYEDGLWDHRKKEFRGFRISRVTDVDGNYSETETLQDDIYKGRPKSQATYDVNGKLYSKTENAWDAQKIYEGVYFVYLKRADNFVYDGDATGRRTAQEFFYGETPQYGNGTKAVQFGEVALSDGKDIGTDSRTIETEYLKNTQSGRWLIGLPKQTVAKDHSGKVVSKSWIYYDGSQNLNDLPTKGLMTQKTVWAGDKSGTIHPTVKYTYDEYGNVLTTTDPQGRKSVVAYDSKYHTFPLTSKNALDHSAESQYFGVNGVAIKGADGSSGLWGQAKSSTDPNKQISVNSYDVFGRVVNSVSPLDSLAVPTSTTSYEVYNDYFKVTNRRRVESGQTQTLDTVQFYDGMGRLIQTKSSSEQEGVYVVSGQVEYNSRGLVERQYLPYFTTNPLDSLDPLDTNRPHTTTQYDAMGRAVKTINPDGSFVSAEYDDWAATTIDENGHKQKAYSDAYGQLIKREEFLGADGRDAQNYPAKPFTLYATTRYEYDSRGNLTKVTDAKNNVTLITYDELGRKRSMNDPDMGFWQYEYDLNGNLTAQIDAKGQRVNFVYDELNRLKNKADQALVNVNYTYDDKLKNFSTGRLTNARYGWQDNTDFNYDKLGREVSSNKAIGQANYTVERSYDAVNRLQSVVYPDQTRLYYTYNAGGQIEKVSDGNLAYIKMDPPYAQFKMNDNAANPVVADGGTGGNNGLATANTSALTVSGKISKALHFDGVSQYVDVGDLYSDIKNDTTGTIAFWVKADVRDVYLLCFGKDNKSSTFNINLHPDGKIHVQNFNTGEYAYTATGSTALSTGVWYYLSVVQDGAELKVYVNGKKEALTWQNAFHKNAWISFVGAAQDKNFIASAKWDTYRQVYFKGAIDDFRYYKKPLSLEEVTVLYNSGKGTEEKSPAISNGGTPATNVYVKNVDYNANGQITKIEYGNNVVTTYEYYPLNYRLKRVYTANTSMGLQDLNYTYDKLGNIVQIADKINTASQTFKYDALNRLIEANGAKYGKKIYRYNEIGNILEKDGLTYTYGERGAGPHAVTSLSDGTTFDYDQNGNTAAMIKGGVFTQYIYDAENRLVEVKKDLLTIAQYEYDGDGGRTRKTIWNYGTFPLKEDVYVAPQSTSYIGSLYEETGGQPTKHLFLGSTRVVSITGSKPTYYHGDHLGGTNILTNGDGLKKELVEYLPFGGFARREKYGNDEDTAWFYFTGKPLDDETGLYYYGARYYDPSLGRFITPDSMVQDPNDPQSLNRYSYVRNNPVNLVDPTGHFWFIPAIIAAFKAVAAVATAVGSYVAANAAVIATGAAVGGAVGGISSYAMGGNIWQGIGYGALGGAVFSGLTPAFSGMMKGIYCGTTQVSLIGNAATISNFVSASLAGAASGAAVAGVAGADVGDAALFGGAVAGGVSLVRDTALWMRQKMVAQSRLDPRNSSGKSAGFKGDNFKLGGGRYDPAHPNGNPSPLGGPQGGEGQLFGIPYKPGSIPDLVVEAYAGPHDSLNSWGYDAFGNLKDQIWFDKILGATLNPLNVVVATPIVIPSVLPQSWVPPPVVIYGESHGDGDQE